MNTSKHELIIKELQITNEHECAVHPILVCTRVYSWFSLMSTAAAK